MNTNTVLVKINWTSKNQLSTIKTISMITKKIRELCGKGSMGLYILKKPTKKIAHPLY